MSFKTITKFSLVVLVAGILLAACGSPSSTQAPGSPLAIELVDGLDRTVTLDTPAQRIISLAPSNTEILFAISAGGQVVGRDDFSDYPVEALDITSIGGSFGDLNTEAILALEPDLVLAAEINTADQVQSLEDLGIKVFWLANPTTIEGMFENLRIVAKLSGQESNADSLIIELSSRVDAVDQALANVVRIPSVFYEIDGSDPNAPWTSGAGTFIDTLISRAKGTNIGSVLDGAYAQISVEVLITQKPDIILLGDAAFGVTPESVVARAGWSGLSAVQNNFIFPFDDNLVSRPGPRLIEGLELLAKLLHPEAFA